MDIIKRALFWRRGVPRHHEVVRPVMRKAASAVLHPDASINNLSGQPDRISVGEASHLRGMLLVHRHGGSISLDQHCFLGPQSIISSMHEIRIGSRVLISHSVQLSDHTSHSLDPVERHRHFLQIISDQQPQSWDELPGVRSAPIVIEDDVWIGFGCTIMKGVGIGRGKIGRAHV